MAMADGGADSGGGELTIEQLFDAQLNAICEYMVRCGSFEDMTTCKNVFGSNARLPNDIVDAVKSGNVNYNAAKARECIDAIAQRSCERWNALGNRPTPPACFEALSGTVANGAACVTNEQCISQQCNQPANCPMACCTGTCSNTPPPSVKNLGDSCAGNSYCLGGYCDVTGVCVAYKPQGATCSSDYECADGLNCRANPANPNDRRCQPMVGLNGPCTSTNDCLELSNVCSNGACREGGLTGWACPAPADPCQPMHVCASGTCALPPGPGGACSSGGFCVDSYCEATTAVCRPKLADGGTCNPQLGGTDCESGVCDSTSTCVTPDCF